MSLAVDFRGISKSFGLVEVLHGVSFKLYGGVIEGPGFAIATDAVKDGMELPIAELQKAKKDASGFTTWLGDVVNS